MGSIVRELEEETGLAAAEAERGELLAILDDHRLSIAQVFRFADPAETLAARVRRYLESAHEDELSGVEVVTATSELASSMPYAVALARYLTSA
jgi:8-oxo-dGTP pyrophosphatase MutT (NUDIX family)